MTFSVNNFLLLSSLITIPSITHAKPIHFKNEHIIHRNNFDNDIILSYEETFNNNKAEGSSAAAQPLLWENGIVYYKFAHKHYTAYEKSKITEAINIIRKTANVRFIEAGDYNTINHIEIMKYNHHGQNYGCSANVGRVLPNAYSPNSLTLGKKCIEIGTILHELLHVLGISHEQTRADRDHHVVLLDENYNHRSGENHITDSVNYYKRGSENTRLTEFDFDSIMLYNPYSSTKNNLPTMIPTSCLEDYNQNYWKYEWEDNYTDPTICEDFKRMNTWKTSLSNGDIKSLVLLYGEPNSKTVTIKKRNITTTVTTTESLKTTEEPNTIDDANEGLRVCLKEHKSSRWYLNLISEKEHQYFYYNPFSPNVCSVVFFSYVLQENGEWTQTHLQQKSIP